MMKKKLFCLWQRICCISQILAQKMIQTMTYEGTIAETKEVFLVDKKLTNAIKKLIHLVMRKLKKLM